MASRIYTAPAGTGEAIRGKTLPDVMYDACARHANPRALNQPLGDGTWKPYACEAFRVLSEETALGLRSFGLARGDRVAFFLESDVNFCIADMGCLLAGLANVPIYLTHTGEAIQYVMAHSEAKALFVTDVERLRVVAPLLAETEITTVVVMESAQEKTMPSLPEGVGLATLDAIRKLGQARLQSDPRAIDALRAEIHPDDLATIVYTSGTTGQPKGVMLSHENISFNVLTAFSGMTGYQPGPDGEKGISFLPLTHVFARTLHYGFLAYGTSVYFSSPNDLGRDLLLVRPTFFATVPRVLEKVYARIMEKAGALEGAKKHLFAWAMKLADDFELGETPSLAFRVQHALADRLIFDKWRAALGGQVKYLICGGAALNANLANLFAAAGVNVLQGYGLSETSPVISFNRPDRNRAGTVGEPIPGVEVMIADDGEILTRGPHIMKGYFKAPEKTREVIDGDGWFHTGDIGVFTDEGFLRITDRKKDLFKLSTGKYVMPQPLENALCAEALVAQAVVVGNGQKYAGALIFPELDTLRPYCLAEGIDPNRPPAELVREPVVRAAYQRLVDRANEGMDHWSTIKKFRLVPAEVTIENGLLTPTLKVRRSKVSAHFADEVTALYNEAATPA